MGGGGGWEAMRCDAMRCEARRGEARRGDGMRCDAMRCDAMRCDAMRCDAMRCDAMRRAQMSSDELRSTERICYVVLCCICIMLLSQMRELERDVNIQAARDMEKQRLHEAEVHAALSALREREEQHEQVLDHLERERQL